MNVYEEYQKRREEYERLLKNIDTARKKQKRFFIKVFTRNL